MRTRATVMLLLGLLAPLAALPVEQAAAGECELKVLRQDDGVDISAGAWSATCVAGSGCAVLGPEVDGQRLQLARRLDDAGWQVVLSLPRAADAAAGVQLGIDDAPTENLPGEFLEERAGGRALALRAEVAGVVLDMLRKAKRQARWFYVTKGGEQRQMKLGLACLRPVLAAAERRLAELKAMKRLGK